MTFILRIVCGALLLISFNQASAQNPEISKDWTVTKTIKWSLLDRIAKDLCEAEREDCDADWRCGKRTDGNVISCLTVGVSGSAAIWTLYRDKARRALEAIP